VSNYDVRAVLALPPMPERQRLVLIALATVTPEADGWRHIGGKLLAGIANLHPDTVKKARPELIKAGLLDYEAGDGRGHYSRYRLNVPGTGDREGGSVSHTLWSGKGRSIAHPLCGPRKAGSIAHPLRAERGGRQPRKGGVGRPRKGGTVNSLTCKNPITVLKTLSYVLLS
jgi:hypothetical protein